MYEPYKYWQERGQTAADSFTPDKVHFIRQFLKHLSFDSAFEIGCGDGQMTRILLEFLPIELYYGVDLSAARIKAIKQQFEKIAVEQKDIRFFETKPLFDLVVCSHVLLHIPPEDIAQVMIKALNSCKRHFVFFEPKPEIDLGQWSEYNFNHDYELILQELGYDVKFYRFDNLTGIYHVEKH